MYDHEGSHASVSSVRAHEKTSSAVSYENCLAASMCLRQRKTYLTNKLIQIVCAPFIVQFCIRNPFLGGTGHGIDVGRVNVGSHEKNVWCHSNLYLRMLCCPREKFKSFLPFSARSACSASAAASKSLFLADPLRAAHMQDLILIYIANKKSNVSPCTFGEKLRLRDVRFLSCPLSWVVCVLVTLLPSSSCC